MAMRPRLGITGRIVAVVAVAATLAALLMWWATAQGLSPLYALPVSIGAPLLLALFVSNDIAEPLKGGHEGRQGDGAGGLLRARRGVHL
jgi:hypothetical protein